MGRRKLWEVTDVYDLHGRDSFTSVYIPIPKPRELYTLNMYSFLHVNNSSMKCF